MLCYKCYNNVNYITNHITFIRIYQLFFINKITVLSCKHTFIVLLNVVAVNYKINLMIK